MLSGVAQPDPMQRASAFERAAAVAAAERVVEVDGGVAIFRDDLPSVWSLNLVWFDVVPATATAASLAVQADTMQGEAGLSHRQIVVADEQAGARLADGFSALRWTVSASLYMARQRLSDRPSNADVRDLDEPGQRPFRERLLRELPDGYTDDVIYQLRDAKRAVSAAVPTRWFAAYVDGEPASICELYVLGRTAQIEDVSTLEEYRNRGLASAVILRAVEEAQAAGAEFVFLVADEDDWPKHLYERLGFDPIGRAFSFVRKPGDGS